MGHVLCGRGRSADRRRLALIGSVAPNLRLCSMQQARYHLTVMHISRRHFSGMDDLLLTVDADMALHPEIPLIALPGLVHFGVTFALLVFSR